MQIQQEADVVVLAVPGPTFDASNAKTILRAKSDRWSKRRRSWWST